MPTQAVSRARAIKANPEAGPGAVAGFILVEVCRRAMNAVARRDLEDDLFEMLPSEYYGYLIPRKTEGRGPDRERLLVHLLQDLASALLGSTNENEPGSDMYGAMLGSEFSRDYSEDARDDDRQPVQKQDLVTVLLSLTNEDDSGSDMHGATLGSEFSRDCIKDALEQHRLRVQKRAVWLYVGVDQHPCGFEEAIDLAASACEPSVVRSRGRRRPLLLDGFAQTFDRWSLPEREAPKRTRVPRRVGLAGMRGVDRWLRQASSTGPGSTLFEAWQTDRGQDVSRMALLLITLQVAAARFHGIEAEDSLTEWYQVHGGDRYFRPDSPCRLCPGRKFGGSSCTCAARVMRIAVGSKGRSGRALRGKDPVEIGQAAVEIAAQSLANVHPREWPGGESLKWVLGQYPIRRRAVDIPDSEELDALGRLLRGDLPEPNEIEQVAKFIDDTTGAAILREVAALGRAGFTRFADHQHDLDSGYERAFAELGRTLAGAFRELRSPASTAFQRQLARSTVARHPKTLEALQDLQLAEQRLWRWAPAAAAYEFALDLLAERFPAGTQKRFEIEEQLHLGRLGGLILEAEQLLFQKPTNSAVRARIAAVLDSAITLGGEGGRLQWALGEIASQRAADNVSPEERDVIRYNDRWHVMPQVMLSRAYVTRAAFRLQTGDHRREEDLKRAREIHEGLAGHSDLTLRQQWEIERVALVATAIAAEAADLPARVDGVLAKGGDDGGDYVKPALSWLTRQTPIAGTRLASLLHEAEPALLASIHRLGWGEGLIGVGGGAGGQLRSAVVAVLGVVLVRTFLLALQCGLDRVSGVRSWPRLACSARRRFRFGSGRVWQCADAGERVDVVAFPGPACWQVQCGLAGGAGESSG